MTEHHGGDFRSDRNGRCHKLARRHIRLGGLGWVCHDRRPLLHRWEIAGSNAKKHPAKSAIACTLNGRKLINKISSRCKRQTLPKYRGVDLQQCILCRSVLELHHATTRETRTVSRLFLRFVAPNKARHFLGFVCLCDRIRLDPVVHHHPRQRCYSFQQRRALHSRNSCKKLLIEEPTV